MINNDDIKVDTNDILFSARECELIRNHHRTCQEHTISWSSAFRKLNEAYKLLIFPPDTVQQEQWSEAATSENLPNIVAIVTSLNTVPWMQRPVRRHHPYNKGESLRFFTFIENHRFRSVRGKFSFNENHMKLSYTIQGCNVA